MDRLRGKIQIMRVIGGGGFAGGALDARDDATLPEGDRPG